jgi:hypothetical protein
MNVGRLASSLGLCGDVRDVLVSEVPFGAEGFPRRR